MNNRRHKCKIIHRSRVWSVLFYLMVVSALVLTGLRRNEYLPDNGQVSGNEQVSYNGQFPDSGQTADNVSGNLAEDNPVSPSYLWEVHCIDVGQASAALIISGEQVMLADTGNKKDAGLLLQYLEEQGITKLDYLLLTHPHEDHIGAAAKILREIEVEQVLMPDIAIEMCQTVCYADLLSAIEEKEPLTDYPEAGDTYTLGELTFTVVCPDPAWQPAAEDLNESSLGVRITDGENSILLYGDGKEHCEEYMTEYQEISADILIVGHHGSTYSSSAKFLEAVRPGYAVISCGRDNDYGFPHDAVLERLADVGATVLRTDENGTIVFFCDGKNIIF